MNLNHYIGQYIKVINDDHEWFIGKLLKIMPDEIEDLVYYDFDVISSSKEQKIKEWKKSFQHNDKNPFLGIHTFRSGEIKEVEQLDLKVQQGIILTTKNLANFREFVQANNLDFHHKKVEFGKLDENK